MVCGIVLDIIIIKKKRERERERESGHEIRVYT